MMRPQQLLSVVASLSTSGSVSKHGKLSPTPTEASHMHVLCAGNSKLRVVLEVGTHLKHTYRVPRFRPAGRLQAPGTTSQLLKRHTTCAPFHFLLLFIPHTPTRSSIIYFERNTLERGIEGSAPSTASITDVGHRICCRLDDIRSSSGWRMLHLLSTSTDGRACRFWSSSTAT